MSFRMIIVLILSTYIAGTNACFCSPAQSTKESFCKADWVSHVKVLGTVNNGNKNALNDITYLLEHKDVFKRPEKVKKLPSEVQTALSETACGIKLKIGTEYLLAGSTWENAFFTYRCGQIVQDGTTSSPTEFGMPPEWDNVSNETKSLLRTVSCDNHRTRTTTNEKLDR
ncbi:hypothetical protein ANCCAN_05335 [Ancylostoma caninum]|uniref:NTR domain-containing protein n=1 Tax=Ancylostoma caninum TaxID=29170 RepID=A0A368GZT6_ANCCA|nr:hypothetical protein ANCCAN_05335 [Ancylostoma caninum]